MQIPFRNITRVAVIVALILLIPLVMTIHDGAVEGVGWNWTPLDFLVMGTLLFATGLAIDYALRKISSPAARAGAVAGIVLIFVALWTQMAVGAVSRLFTYFLGG